MYVIMNTYIDQDGFEMITGTNKRMHTFIAEKVLGRKLKKTETIHHIDEDRSNNKNSNLVICERSLHPLIHKRLNALKETGNVHSKICRYCHKYDDPNSMYVYPKTGRAFHRECQNKYKRSKRLRGE